MTKKNISIDDKLFDHLSHLSLLQFSEAEKTKLQKDLKNLIAFCDKVNDFDTTKYTLSNNLYNDENVNRPDDIKSVLEKEKALGNANLKNADFFLVPKMIDK